MISARRVSDARALEAAEEPLDQVGEAGGWHSREAVQAALLLTHLELLNASR